MNKEQAIRDKISWEIVEEKNEGQLGNYIINFFYEGKKIHVQRAYNIPKHKWLQQTAKRLANEQYILITYPETGKETCSTH